MQISVSFKYLSSNESYMRIVISGTPGSGKSTAARLLAERLGYRHFSMGDFQREIAREKGITINELSKLEEKDDRIDRMVDERQRELGKKEDDLVIDSRLGVKFIPHADFRIFLDCKMDERARRIYGHKRSDEAGDIDSVKEKMSQREKSEEKRFRDYYGFDYKDKRHYNVCIDTTELKEGEVVDKILEKIQVR